MAFKRTTRVLSDLGSTSMTDLVFLLLSVFDDVWNDAYKGNYVDCFICEFDSLGTHSITYHLNGDETPVLYSELEDGLVELLQSEEDPTFSIYSDESVPIKEVVSIMNIAKRNHYKVILATQPE